MSHRLITPERFRHELEDALLEHAAMLPGRDALPAEHQRATRRPGRSRIAARRLRPAIMLAAVIVAAVLILRAGGALAPQRATAAGVLRASAAALDRLGGSRAVGPEDYFYTRTAESWTYAGYGPHPYAVRSIQQEWLARDGHGRSRYEVVSLRGAGLSRSLPFTHSQDERLARSPRPFVLSALPAPGILLSYTQLRRLPTEPTRLQDALNRIVATAHVNRLFPQRDYRVAIRFAILRGLAQAPTSVPVRAALYRLLAATPGIHLLGPTRDSIGRHGMAIGVNVPDIQLEIILDPSTGELLQSSRTLLHRTPSFLDGKQPPGLVNQSTFLASGIVPSTHTQTP